MNNIVELAYLIPNAVPEINAHYCIGVLWTIPVQLQYTYVVLAATVVIRDVPAEAVVVGNPARVVREGGGGYGGVSVPEAGA